MKVRRITSAVVVAATAGCSSLQPIPVRAITETRPQVVYITQGNGAVVLVVSPRLRGDSVVGTQVALPLRDVQRISVRQVSKGRTAMLISGMVVLSAVGLYAVTTAGGRSDWYCDYGGPAINELGVPRCGPGGPMLGGSGF
jgi:hypothetical protein